MIFNMLSEKDKSNLEYWINEFSGSEDGYSVRSSNPKAPLEHILRVWESEKEEYLFKMFGNQLILEKDIHFKKGVDNLCEDLSKFVSNSLFVTEFRALSRRNSDFTWLFDSLLDLEYLALNTYKGDTFSIPMLSSGKELVIRNGCKLSRILGKIAKEYDLKGYEEFRIAHSQILNQKELSGKLCLSIHPLDYMTMSDNDCGWDSCMSWSNYGDYRRGTVEMMNSPMVVVAYLTSESPFVMDDFEWNNKKWRELFVVNHEIITHIKGYPYCNEHLDEEVINWLRELAMTNLGWTYEDESIKFTQDKEFVFQGDRYRIRFDADYMYNDFYHDHLAIVNKKTLEHFYRCNFSGAATCMWCGSTHGYYGDASLLACDACDEITYCEYCEERMSPDDCYVIDGMKICWSCYDSCVVRCEICNEDHLEDNMKPIHIALDENHICRGESISICEDCYDDIQQDKMKEFFSGTAIIHKARYRWSDYYFVLLENCTDQLFDLLGYDSKEEFVETRHEYFEGAQIEY